MDYKMFILEESIITFLKKQIRDILSNSEM